MEFENTQNNLILEQEQNNYELENNESELQFNNEEPQATFEDVSNELSFDAPKTNGGGSNDHNELTNRDMENQHPIKSIEGLEEALKNAGNVKGVEVNESNVVDENGVAKISVPRKISQLENDTGYVNKLSTSLVYYYTKKETDDIISALPLGTVVNIIDTFNYNKKFNNNDIYNANAVRSSVDWTVQALLGALQAEYFVSINVVVNPLNYDVISIDGDYNDIKMAHDIEGSVRCVCQFAQTDINGILNLALITNAYAYFTNTMKVDLGAGETKYLIGLYVYSNSRIPPKIFVDALQ